MDKHVRQSSLNYKPKTDAIYLFRICVLIKEMQFKALNVSRLVSSPLL